MTTISVFYQGEALARVEHSDFAAEATLAQVLADGLPGQAVGPRDDCNFAAHASPLLTIMFIELFPDRSWLLSTKRS